MSKPRTHIDWEVPALEAPQAGCCRPRGGGGGGGGGHRHRGLASVQVPSFAVERLGNRSCCRLGSQMLDIVTIFYYLNIYLARRPVDMRGRPGSRTGPRPPCPRG